MKKLFFFIIASTTLLSCQFTETMVMNEDGTGRMSLSMDLSEMMAFGGEMSQDSTFTRQDTIISFKDVFEEKKDSIAKLSKAEQKRLKAMENYNIHMVSDPEENKLVMDIFTDFKDISEANDLMKGFEQTEGLLPGNESSADDSDDGPEPEILGVSYSFKRGVFKRDAFIKDEERHKVQMDSMKQAESFMNSMMYRLKYTFPKKIKNSSVEDATYSLDGKTIEIERSFLDYFKNPDVLDLEIELEN
ncbi:MAG: hypothetical protein KJO05_07165 [Bacteroidia bacterium]|nr:hypothetical protein [Bacteroidia bacterium]NNF32353.1 hypothetical protein [Flavobacteriaceae bacterium]MBT8276337.1 hypothetical protein [Bacteroidia bacterium]NNJ81398.1 hypothetical protein [Flavobacteriaceae bacterium]NNK53229.1 hypothetical protein [Flavobacteriaceae bacterium]